MGQSEGWALDVVEQPAIALGVSRKLADRRIRECVELAEFLQFLLREVDVRAG